MEDCPATPTCHQLVLERQETALSWRTQTHSSSCRHTALETGVQRKTHFFPRSHPWRDPPIRPGGDSHTSHDTSVRKQLQRCEFSGVSGVSEIRLVLFGPAACGAVGIKRHWRFGWVMIPLISLHMKLDCTLDGMCGLRTGRSHLD